MDIRIEYVDKAKSKKPPSHYNQLEFGRTFTNHMFSMRWQVNKGWHDAKISPYQPLSLSPSAMVFHYGLEVFEGLKAYWHQKDEKAVLFRPDKNIERLNRSAKRLCMPEIAKKDFLQAISALIDVEKEWLSCQIGESLYIRPALIATEEVIGLKACQEYLFFCLLSPCGSYYQDGFSAKTIHVCEDFVRASVGGVGDIKTGGNYASAMLAEKKAKEKGASQVLWLDAISRKYIEEVGMMNVFFLMDNQLITPELTGSILPGVTRDSVITIAKDKKINIIERKISIDEVIEAIKSGSCQEAFGSGTAAVISPIGMLNYQDTCYPINNGIVGPLTKKIYQDLTNIQYGIGQDKFNWLYPLF